MDKTTGLKVPFMSPIPELGEVESLDIYADEFIDGINKKSLSLLFELLFVFGQILALFLFFYCQFLQVVSTKTVCAAHFVFQPQWEEHVVAKTTFICNPTN